MNGENKKQDQGEQIEEILITENDLKDFLEWSKSSPRPPQYVGEPRKTLGSQIARFFLAGTMTTALLVIVYFAFDKCQSYAEMKGIFDIVFPAMIGLLGTIFGYYFATETRKK